MYSQVGECWGYNRFLSLERLQTFVGNDQIKIHFAIKPTVYQTQVRDLKLYTTYIESRLPEGKIENLTFYTEGYIFKSCFGNVFLNHAFEMFSNHVFEMFFKLML